MVGIFTGFGAGVERGSANILGGAGQLGGAGLGRGGENVSVNAATGNLVISRRDEFLTGIGPDAAVSRSYNSLVHTGDRDNGDQWQQSTTRRVFGLYGDVNTAGSTVQRLGADGSVINYAYSERDGELAYWAIDGAGAHDQLDYDGANNRWTWEDGDSLTREFYDAAEAAGEYRLTELIDVSDQKLTYSYEANSDRLHRITTQNGEWIEYKWDVTRGHITQIDTGYLDSENGNTQKYLTRVYYGYEASGAYRLTSVTTDLSPEDQVKADGDIYTISYQYVDATSNLISKVSQSDGSELSITYNADGRVETLTQLVVAADGSTPAITRTTSLAYHIGYTVVTHPDATTTRMDYDAGGRLLQITTTPPDVGLLKQIRQFEYDDDGNVTRIIESEGNAPSDTSATGGLDVAPALSAGGGSSATFTSTGRGDNEITGIELNPDPGHGLADGTLPSGWAGWNRAETTWQTLDGPYAEAGAGNVSALALTNTGSPASGTDHNGNANLSQSVTLDGSKAYEYTFYFQRNTNSDFRFLAGPGYAPRDANNNLVATFKNAHSGAENVYSKLWDRTTNSPYQPTPYELGTWYKFVGYILPEGTEALGNSEKRGGIYNTQTGQKLANSNALIWSENRLNDEVNFTLSVSGFTQSDGSDQARVWKPEIREVTDLNAILKNDDTLDVTADAELNGPAAATQSAPPLTYADTGRGLNLSNVELPEDLSEAPADGTLPNGWGGWNTGETNWQTVDAPYSAPGSDDSLALNLTNLNGDAHSGRAEFASPLALDPSKHHEYTFYFQHNSDDNIRFNLRPDPYATDANGTSVPTFKNAQNGGLSINHNMVDLYTNPASQPDVEQNKWYKAVVYILADGSPSLGGGKRGGIYDIETGAKFADVNTLIWNENRVSDTTSLRLRMGGLTGTDPAKGFKIWRPEIREVDQGAILVDGAILDVAVDEQLLTSSNAATGGGSGSGANTPTGAIVGAPVIANDMMSRETLLAYDANGNVIRTTDANGNVIERTYDNNNNLISETWTGTHEGVAGVTRTSHYLYNSDNRLRFTVNAEGEVTQFSHTDAGLLLYQIRYPEHNYAVGSSAPTFSQVKTWIADLPDKSSSQIVRNEYDARGNQTTTTRYTSHPNGGAVWSSQGGPTASTKFVYDQAGQLLETRSGSESFAHSVYDGLGRVVASSDGAGNTVTVAFEDAGSKTIITNAADFITTQVYNLAGELLTLSEGTNVAGDINAADTSYSEYDDMGRLSVFTDALGRKSYFLYDEVGRQTGVVDHDGYLTEFFFDESNRQIASVAYATASAIPVSSSSQDYVRPAGNASDVWSFTIYDDGGRVLQTINAGGEVTGFEYDKANNLTRTTAYANTVDISGLKSVGSLPTDILVVTPDSAADIVTRSFYDLSGRQIAALDAEGYLTEMVYDSAGQMIRQTAYAGQTQQVDWATGTLAALRASANTSGSRSVHSVFNGLGQLRYTVDQLGYVTGFEYNNAGQVTKTTAFHTAISTSDYTFDGVSGLVGVPGGTDRSSTTTYDNAGRVASTTDAAGLITSYTYDSLNNVVATQRNDNGDIRTTYTHHDGQGRLIYAVDGEGYVTSFHYDAADQLIAQRQYNTKLGGGVDRSDAGAVATAVAGDANFVEQSSSFDDLGRLQTSSNAIGDTVTYSYDGLGRQTQVIVGSGNDQTTTTSAYDVLGRVASVTQAADQTAGKRYKQVDVQATAADQVVSVKNSYANNFAVEAGEQLAVSVSLESTGSIDSARAAIFWLNSAGQILSSTIVGDIQSDPIPYNSEISGVVEVPSGATSAWLEIYAHTKGSGAGTFRLIDPSVVHLAEDGSPTELGNVIENAEFDGLDDWVIAYNPDGIYQTRSVGQAGAQKNGALGEEITSRSFYDNFGRTTTMVDGKNNTAYSQYDNRGLVIQTTNAEGGVTTYEHNAFGEVIKATDARGNSTYTYYDDLGRVTHVVDAENYVTETTYTSFGEVETVTRYENKATGTPSVTAMPAINTDANEDAITTFGYDNAGRLVQTTDAENYVETFSYNAFGERVLMTGKSETANSADGSNNVTTYVYDKRGLMVSETMPATALNGAGVGIAITNSYIYDARGNRVSMTEGVGLDEARTTTYIYDAANRLIETRGQAREVYSQDTHQLLDGAYVPKEYISYDARGNVTKTVDASGATTIFFYDDLNRKVVEIDALGTYTAYEYDKNSNVERIRIFENQLSVPANAASDANYVGGSQEEAQDITDPGVNLGNARETLFEYDALNRMTKSSVVGVHNGFYDTSLQNPAWVANADNFETLYEYDANGNVVKTTDPMGNETHAYYDHLGRKIVQVDAEGYATKWEYDSEGNVLTETQFADPINNAIVGTVPTTPSSGDDRITLYTYDEVGNRLTETRIGIEVYDDVADNGTTKTVNGTVVYTYNGLGQVLSKTEATGDAITYTYDDGGRLDYEERSSFIGHTGASVTPRVDYAYDGLGNLTQSTSAGAAGIAARTTTYEYNDGGLLSRMVDAEDNERLYYYDKSGRQIVEAYDRTDHDTTTPHREAALTKYDLLGRVIEQKVVRDISTSGPENWQSDTSAIGNDETITQTHYNAFGDVIATGINVGTGDPSTWQTTNKYDLAGRLWATNAGDGVWKFFGYDKNGNQTLALTSAGAQFTDATTFQSAFNGIDGADVNATYTQYDARNMAVQVVEEGRELAAGTEQDLTTSREYNAFGEVVSETDARGATLNYTYNTMGRMIRSTSPVVSITNEDGSTQLVRPSEDFYYDLSGRLVAQGDANGIYDVDVPGETYKLKAADDGNLTRLELLAGTGYDGTQALITKQTASDFGITQTSFDVHGDARQVDMLVLGDGQSSTDVWRTTNQEFDKLGRLTKVTQPNGLVQRFEYDEQGQRIAEWYENVGVSGYGSGNKQTTTYDKQGRVIGTRAYGGDITTTAYHWDGSLEADESGLNDTGGWVQTTKYHYGSQYISKSLTETSDVFGRAISKNDLGGHTTTYEYDKAGRQKSSLMNGETASYTYFNTGQIATNTNLNGVASYEYDAAGNRTREVLAGKKNQSAAYDLLGRLTSWSEAGTSVSPAASETHSYDANGNIRRTQSDFYRLGPSGQTLGAQWSTDDWFAFDSMNRVVIVNGIQEGDHVVRRNLSSAAGANASLAIAYNRAGERMQSTSGIEKSYTYWVNTDPNISIQSHNTFDLLGSATSEFNSGYWNTVYYDAEQREEYSYDGAGQLIQIDQAESDFDAQDFELVVQYSPAVDPQAFVSAPGTAQKLSEFQYDRLGRQTRQQDFKNGGTKEVFDKQSFYNAKGQLIEDDTSTANVENDTNRRVTRYDYGNASNYALGQIIHTIVDGYKNGDDSSRLDSATKYIYDWYDNAVQKTIYHDNRFKNDHYDTVYPGRFDGRGIQQGFDLDTLVPSNLFDTNDFDHDYTTTQSYNAFGQLTSAYVQDGLAKNVTFTLDETGQIIRRQESSPANATQTGAPVDVWYRYGGAEMGHSSNNGTSNVFTTTSIAERTARPHEEDRTGTFLGGSNTGSAYIDASGFEQLNSYDQGSRSGTYTVRGGESLQQIAASTYGDANLWYKIAQANGLSGSEALSAGRTLRMPAGVVKSTHSASTFKPYNPGEAVGELSPTSPKPSKGAKCGVFGQILVAAVAVGVAIWAGPGAIAFFEGLGTVGAAIAGGAVAGAAGSIASQGVGLATGIQNSFSFKSVGLAAIAGAVGGGFRGLGELGNAGKVGKFLGGSGFGSAVTRGVASSAISQGIGVATGLQDSFSFAGVAAAGVAAGIGNALGGDTLDALKGDGLTGANFASHLGVGAARLFASAATRSAIEGSSFGKAIEAGLPDVIGQVVGQVIGGAVVGTPRPITGSLVDGYSRERVDAFALDRRFDGLSRSEIEQVILEDYGKTAGDPAAIAQIYEESPEFRQVIETTALGVEVVRQNGGAPETVGDLLALRPRVEQLVSGEREIFIPGNRTFGDHVIVAGVGLNEWYERQSTGTQFLADYGADAIGGPFRAGLSFVADKGIEAVIANSGQGELVAALIGELGVFSIGSMGSTTAEFEKDYHFEEGNADAMHIVGGASIILGLDSLRKLSLDYQIPGGADSVDIEPPEQMASNAALGTALREVLRVTEAANPLVDSLRATGGLPSNFVTKAQARAAGWAPGKALDNFIPGAQIGGDVFRNSPAVLPSANGRVWYEADVGLSGTMSRSNQPGSRLLYSNDGQLFITTNHYESIHSIGTWK
ncbi:MAG: ribonuclease domain-containing protein [Erythrobacter sp.]|uniref:LysM peptidoglycan-binding domain-containing protein n=1 Tax=Erythrobacter sp. TaxID=1042 RepID=UPI0032662C6D